MPRIPYVTDRDLTPAQQEIWAYFRDVRGKSPSDTHRLMAHAPHLLRAFLELADATQRVGIARRERELITMMSAFLTDKEYVWAHHWDRTIRAGVTEEQLRSLGAYETAPCFSENDRDILRYMHEAMTRYRVGADTFEKVRRVFAGDAGMMEFMMVVAFTSFTAYIHGPAEIEIEPKYAHVPSIASLKTGAAPAMRQTSVRDGLRGATA